MTYADKQAMLARGEPWIVHPREVAKLAEFQGTDPEIILVCILEAGILDTADIRASIHHSDVLSGSESRQNHSLASLALRDSTGLHGLDKDPLIDNLLSDG